MSTTARTARSRTHTIALYDGRVCFSTEAPAKIVTVLEHEEALAMCAKIRAKHPDILERLPNGSIATKWPARTWGECCSTTWRATGWRQRGPRRRGPGARIWTGCKEWSKRTETQDDASTAGQQSPSQRGWPHESVTLGIIPSHADGACFTAPYIRGWEGRTWELLHTIGALTQHGWRARGAARERVPRYCGRHRISGLAPGRVGRLQPRALM